MQPPRSLCFYLDDPLRRSAEAGDHNFIRKIENVVRAAGFEVQYLSDSDLNRARAIHKPGYSLFHMQPPANRFGLTFRRVYHYPFWAIEPVAERWNWRVAKAAFQSETVDRTKADRFAAFWRKRLFPQLNAGDDGFVYVPLQGRLTIKRSFQSASPLDMIKEVLQRDNRPVVATLHPNETYSPEDLSALERLEARFSRFRVEMGQMERFLPCCSYVVTQNSSAAFNGFFFDKPALLFAKSDFHHIAANVPELGCGAAFETVCDMCPDYAGFIWWFWQVMSINAGRPEAEENIRTALRRAGWPI